MRNYYRVMLGEKSAYAAECHENGFIGTDFEIHQDLTGKLPDQWKAFNKEFIPIFQRERPDKGKIAAGLACGALWTVSKGITTGDIVLCPNGSGRYLVGEVTGNYHYVPGQNLPHRRPVRWLEAVVDRADMSAPLQHSAGSIGTVSNVTKYSEELERLIGGIPAPTPQADPTVENLTEFVLEKHLEDFLVDNWAQTDLGKMYDIYSENGEPVGQQYPTDTGPLDILAVSKDKKTLLVVELKKGRASDAVVGQTLRYMGFVSEELAEDTQTVRGVIIALEDDQRIRRALSMSPNIEFYRYRVSFKLVKA